MRDFLRAGFDVIVHAATTRSNRGLGAPPDMLDRNCRMFFNLARNQGLFGKMLHFGSGAVYGRECLPARVSRDLLDTRVPRMPTVFRSTFARSMRNGEDNIFVLRLFGVFGKYEAWDVRFISNAFARVAKGLPIVIRQNVAFDYLYVEDLVKLTAWFIENEPRQKTYNVCRGSTLPSGAGADGRRGLGARPEITVRNQGMGPEYSGDNTRMLDEIGGYRFREIDRMRA